MKCAVCGIHISNENTSECQNCQSPLLFMDSPDEVKKFIVNRKEQWKVKQKEHEQSEELKPPPVKSITGLISHTQGSDILLTWAWPENIDFVKISFRHDAFPVSETDSLAISINCTREEYDLHGYWRLRESKKKVHFFSISTISSEGAYSLPVTIKTQAGIFQEVHYKLIKKKRLGLFSTSAVSLQIRGVKEIGYLKGLILVGNENGIPISPQNGVVLLSDFNIDLTKDGMGIIFLAEEHWHKKLFLRLFFRQVKDAEAIHLIHDSGEKMRLG